MKTLLLAATQFEIAPFLLTKHHCDVVIGGVGMLATAYHLTKQLSHHHYDMVIQAGVAGAFQQEGAEALELGEVVVVHQDAAGDMGAYENGTMISLQSMQLDSHPEWLHNKHWAVHKLPYRKVTGITVNTVTDDAGIIAAMQKKWHAHVESMEGAALHYICLQKEVPFIQLRAISNFVGERDKSRWKMKEAIIHLNTELANSIELLH